MTDIPPPPPPPPPPPGGEPQQPGWGQAPPPPPMPAPYVTGPGTNGMAIAALAVGLVGLCMPLAGVLAIVLGFVARSQLRASGEAGDGMAIAGIVLGFVGLAEMLLVMAVFLPSATSVSVH